MRQIVYFLGAGFSAPAGLPVVSNFLFRAKDQYAADRDRYSYFEEVFRYIDGLSKAKNYIHSDLFNIEEIFSIADIHRLLGNSQGDRMENFIKDVILYHTPFAKRTTNQYQTNNDLDIFWHGSHIQRYVKFASCLAGCAYRYRSGEPFRAGVKNWNEFSGDLPQRSVIYRIITLNYDRLIEDSLEALGETFGFEPNIPIAKLHGTVDGKIVPPTWNKQIGEDLVSDWSNAAKWLRDANEIRILGYSLPSTDMYVKHLFSAAFLESANLQKIDVLTMDSDGATEARYQKLFGFPRFTFVDGDIGNYLSGFKLAGPYFGSQPSTPHDVERTHSQQLDSAYQRSRHGG